MSKQKITFKCTSCNYQSVRWLGNCPECNQWNSFVEFAPVLSVSRKAPAQLHPLNTITTQPKARLRSTLHEWDHVLGGGIIPGSFLLLTGDPGIGKSTLLLQVANTLAHEHQVFYFSSEESLEQVRLRASRINVNAPTLLFSDTADLEEIIAIAQQEKPDILILDSIQNCFFSQIQTIPGSIGQLREAGFRLMRLAKENGIAVIVTGHITKEGIIAGPKALEHMADGVFYLQGEDRWQTRVLRAVKNRFGSINELGFFHMGEHGLQEVPNINEQLLQESSHAPGSALISHLEGSRPLLLELQALTVPSKFGVPQRVITGVDHKQVMIIVAILEKYLQVKLSSQDIFFKVSGGMKVKDSSADLGIALALLSSYFQQPLPEKSLALGEMSLTGQIKPINQINEHLHEAEKFNLNKLFVAKNQVLKKTALATYLSSVYDLLQIFPEA